MLQHRPPAGPGLRASRGSSSRVAARPAPPCGPGRLLAGGRPCRRVLARSAPVWDDSMTLADLKAQLDAAIEEEDYDLAARIRDELQHKQSDARLAVEDANKRFYDAFASGRIEEMSKVWGKGEHVQTIHPGSGVIAGREQVMESWRAILRGVRPRAFRIQVEDVRVWATDTTGVVTCTEVVDADDSKGRTIATNVFEKQNGKWVMTHHHGSPLMRGFR